MPLLLQGVYTALVTPFSADGATIDFDAYEKLLAQQIDGGVSGLVPCGTTGESPTLSDAEQRELIARTVRFAKGRVPVLAGSGSFNTKKSIEASKAAFEAGADGVMIVMPYYNKPSQEGMYRHVTEIAKAVSGPVVVYNVPGRHIVELSVDTFLRIADTCPNVVGIKDASGNCFFVQELQNKARGRLANLSGDDPLTLPMMAVGAKGVISVTSNVYPKQMSDLVADALAGRWAEAERKSTALYPIHRALFCEPSPAPTKAALAMKNMMSGSVRLPMVEATDDCKATLSTLMKAYEAQ
ncbi:MAG: 4-hydroxy-tetrahydrodipicolinate synthase [Polyangiaceae bacterium]|jgi:4-hydroxy-tetrahydrodipicolinate synthase|nr:4-hydroxy-tetrahydrodipicolinate synthase [Polyangiaceae bacterium]